MEEPARSARAARKGRARGAPGVHSIPMWKTPRGERKLEGRERELFIKALLALYDMFREGEESGAAAPDVGVTVFDAIPLEDRAMAVLIVGEQVLGDGPGPGVRAWNAGTLGAIFAHLETLIELEIDSEDLGDAALAKEFEEMGLGIGREEAGARFAWRKLIHDTWMDRCFPGVGIKFEKGEGDRQPLESKDLDAWTFKIEGLAGELLEDDDYRMETFMDVMPGQAAAAKEYLGIERDYFTDVPPVLSSEEKERLRAFHGVLLREASGR